MLRNKEDSPEEDAASKVFVGVRFVLLGFSPVEEAKVRSKLVSGGGIDVGEYNPGCTHVIVDKIVYDDPSCVVARNDDKTVVTALWIDHSFDVGMPIDATSILYRPVKDLDGIPGAKLLSICLTGYQRQDRDDIMRMVGLMGAHFSKPLVANKVTHLICYKFEGEKYELAKKLKRIKLVNHKWLEDCLREWEILPECHYTKSGYELEIMEAEAKDSEEETEEHRDFGQLEERKITTGPSNLHSGSGIVVSKGSDSKLPVVVEEVPKILNNTAGGKSLLDIAEENVTNHMLGKSIRKDLHDTNRECPGMFACQGTEAYGRNGMSSGLSFSSDRSPNFNNNKSSSLASNAVTAKTSPYSEAAELSNLTYARKTPMRSPASMLSKTLSSHVQGSPVGQLGDCKDISPPKFVQVNSFDLGAVQIPQNESEFGSKEGRYCTLPQKRKTALSVICSKSPKKGGSPRSKATDSPSSTIRPEKLLIEAPQMTCSPLFHNSDCLDFVDGRKFPENQAAELPKTKPLSNTSLENGLAVSRAVFSDRTEFPSDASMLDVTKEMTPEGSLGGLKKSDLSAQPVTGDAEMSNLADAPATKAGEPQKPNVNVSCPNNINSEIVHVARTSEASTSSLTKKTLSKKSLGARPKLSASNTDRREGSLHLDNSINSSGATVCSIQGKDGGEDEKAVGNVSEMAGSTFTTGRFTEENASGILSSENKTEDRSVYLDDETEVLEDPGIELEKAVSEGKAELALQAHNTMEINLKGMLHSAKEMLTDIAHPDTMTSREDGSEHPKASSCKKTEVENLITKEESTIGKKHLLTKSKGKATSILRGTKKPKKEEDIQEIEINDKDENMNVEITNEVEQPAGKSNNLTLPVNKTKKTTVAPENKPIENRYKTKGGKGLSSKSKKSSVSALNEIEISGKEKGGLEQKKKPTNEKKNVERAKVAPSLPNKLENRTEALEKKEKAMDDGNEHGALQIQDLVNSGKHLSSKSKKNHQHIMKEMKISRKGRDGVELESKTNDEKMVVKAGNKVHASKRTSKSVAVNKADKHVDEEKENKQTENVNLSANSGKRRREVDDKSNRTPMQASNKICGTASAGVHPGGNSNSQRSEPPCFILSGHRMQRKEFQQVIRRLKGRICRDSHHWSYQATHFIVPDPVRRTEKFFAAVASGRWILRTDYLTACNQAGSFLAEEPYEWFKNGLSEDGAINLEAPRKWRLLRERTGHGALHGMRIIIYGECIAPPLDTLKRAVKAGDGIILATSPPYTRFLKSGVDFAVVSPTMLRVDPWVQEFIKHEIPCIVADYLVEYVCKPGYSLERHILYNTHVWAEKSFESLQNRAEEIVEASSPSEVDYADISCQVCGSLDRPDVMLICGDETGSLGCGIGTHIDCCEPPLQAVPEEDWFCTKCSKSTNITNPPKTTKKGYSSSLKRRHTVIGVSDGLGRAV